MGEGKRRQQAQDAPANGTMPMAYAKATPYWLVFTTGEFGYSVEMTARHLEMLARMPSAHNADNPPGFDAPEFTRPGAPHHCVVDRQGKILFGGKLDMHKHIAECAERGLLQTYLDCMPGLLKFEGGQEILWIDKDTGLLIDSNGDKVTDPIERVRGKVRYAAGGEAEAYFLADAPLYLQATLPDPGEGDPQGNLIPRSNKPHVMALALSSKAYPPDTSDTKLSSLSIIDQMATLSLKAEGGR